MAKILTEKVMEEMGYKLEESVSLKDVFSRVDLHVSRRGGSQIAIIYQCHRMRADIYLAKHREDEVIK